MNGKGKGKAKAKGWARREAPPKAKAKPPGAHSTATVEIPEEKLRGIEKVTASKRPTYEYDPENLTSAGAARVVDTMTSRMVTRHSWEQVGRLMLRKRVSLDDLKAAHGKLKVMLPDEDVRLDEIEKLITIEDDRAKVMRSQPPPEQLSSREWHQKNLKDMGTHRPGDGQLLYLIYKAIVELS